MMIGMSVIEAELERAAHGCVALGSKGLDREVVRSKIYPYLLEPAHWLGVTTTETTRMYRGRREVWTLEGGPTKYGGIAFSPDGTLVAVCRDGGSVIADAATGALTRVLSVPGRRIVWGPGPVVAICNQGKVVVVSIASEATMYTVSNASPERLQEPDQIFRLGSAKDVAFSRDGTRLIVVGGFTEDLYGVTLAIVDTADGAIITKKSSITGSSRGRMALSPDGQRLAVASQSVSIYTYDEHLGDFYQSDRDDIEASGFGGLIGLMERDGLIDRPPREDPKRLRKIRFGNKVNTRSVAFAPDGATLAVGLTDRCVLLDTSDYTIRHRDLYTTTTPPPEAPAQGETHDQETQKKLTWPFLGWVTSWMKPATPEPRITITIHDDDTPYSSAERRESQFRGAATIVVAVTFTPTSNVLAAASKTGVALFDVASGAKLYDLILPDGEDVLDLAYRPLSQIKD